MSDSVAILILAAGGSTRLGWPKQLLRIRGQTLLARAVATGIESAVGPVFVVLGAHASACREALAVLPREFTLIKNAEWSEGMASSLRAGTQAAEATGVSAVILMTCDQPAVDAALLRRLVAVGRETGALAVASSYGGTVGVPALLRRPLFSELLALRGDIGARAILRGLRPPAATVAFPEGEQDVDTTSDAERVRGG